ncbi:ABC transporter permease [Myroides sp. DF42-4-2]|uniref:ABC transporter permease n=1 Tax=unclassified Myroides TaxID=2642485 RepID=UPI0025775618|nr:ABC transporter permease [Myroides sp. DF42-4-2]MDM1408795.1 ABC transporter permease [Myroides sp. DF42-4-2]
MVSNWLKLYFRYFKKNIWLSLLNILGLAIGMATLIIVLFYWKNEHSFDQWNPYKNRVYEVEGTADSYFKNWFPAPIANQLDQATSIIEAYNFSYMSFNMMSVVVEGKADFLYDIDERQANFFEFFPFTAVFGSAEAYKQNYKDALALEKNEAERLFGVGIDPIGKLVQLDNGKVLTVRFVFEIPGNSSIRFKGLTSYVTESQIAYNRADNWGDHNYRLLLKLKEGIGINEVEKQLQDVFYKEITQLYAQDEGVSVEELKEKMQGFMVLKYNELSGVHLNPESSGLGAGPAANKIVNIMLFSAILLLVLALVNAINLALVQSFKRAKEIGIRKAIGSTQRQLLKQMMFEAGITTLFSFAVALVLVELGMPYFTILVSRTLTTDFLSLVPVLALLLLGVYLLLGVLPSLFVASFDAIKVLKGNFSRSKSGLRLRNALLVFQFVIAFFFLSTAIFVQQQVSHLLQEDLGFNGDQVVNIRFKVKDEKQRSAIYQRIEADLQKIEGVRAITNHSMLMGSGYGSSSSNMIGEVSFQSENVPVGYDFLKVFDGQLVEGRFFDRAFASDSINKIVVNETYKRTFNFSDGIIGKKMKWNGRDFEIIGVVKDMKIEGFSQKIPPVTYFMPNSVGWFSGLIETISVKIDPENVQHTLTQLEAFWTKRVEQTYPMQYEFSNKEFAVSYQKTLYERTLFLWLMGVSMFIALFGLMAIVSFSIESRLKEIAIRKVLGASRKELVFNLSARFMVYCVFGFVLSVYPVYYLLQLWLEDFVYRIDLSIWPFLFAFIGLTFFSMLLVFWKSIKATRISTLKYINYE